MRLVYTALIHLRDPIRPINRTGMEPLLRVTHGVEAVTFALTEPLITVRFDPDQIGVADLVRLVEDCGLRVSSVAQRWSRMAG